MPAQVKCEGKETVKLLKSAEQALKEFEAATSAWQATSGALDEVLRGMGDAEHLLQSMQASAAALADRLTSTCDATSHSH